MAHRIRDRYGNEIDLTDERWSHIVEGHPELEEFLDEVLETVRTGRRRQDPLDPQKYRYTRAFNYLPFGATHLVVIVKLIRTNFIVTAYTVQRGKRR